LMVGSIVKLWPLQRPTQETANLDPKNRVMEYVAVEQWNGSLVLLMILTLGSFLTVMAIEWYGRKQSAAIAGDSAHES